MDENQKHEKFTYAHLYGVVPKPTADFPRKTLAEDLASRLERQELELEDAERVVQELQDQLQKANKDKRLLEQLLGSLTVEDLITDMTTPDELVEASVLMRDQSVKMGAELKERQEDVPPELEAMYNSGRYAGERFTKITEKENLLLPDRFHKLFKVVKADAQTETGACRLSVATMCEKTGKSRRQTITDQLKQLCDARVFHKIKTKPYLKDGEYRQRPHWYRVNHPDYWDMEVLNMNEKVYKQWKKENNDTENRCEVHGKPL